ncbi:MAG: pyrimidine-nucleoside phosphorylase [Chloroflexaceae bacterium]|jgi:pyrimidine-nucleoside phosphorylase|nr:pyrimidine-nucleoside phosphorylase [Chloroflexaceae bacterium]
MRAVDIIAKKRDGGTLTTDEIQFLVAGYTSGAVPDYQMAAWAMAVLLRGMDSRETADLTLAMAHSGDMLDLHDLAPLTVDKHSTGGIGDKTTLVLAPLVAALGLPVAKMSGRGLGFSGGTIDKLESIPGFRTALSAEEFRQAVREIGLVVAGQSGDLAPADKRLYALRDVTATVESIPLIAASVMSKKLAAGADCIVLDVKYGRGAFMSTPEQARQLAQTMVAIGQHAGRRVAAVLSSMEQPLGYAIGNALEVREAVAALRGRGPADLVELCLILGAELLLLAGKTTAESEARRMLEAALANGAAWRTFCRMVTNQGGDLAVLEEPDALPRAPVVLPLPAPTSGVVAAIEGQTLGLMVNALGGGRERKEDTIDPAVGLVLAARVGDRVTAGEPLLHIHATRVADAERVAQPLLAAYTIGSEAVAPPPLVLEVVRG